MTVEKGHSNGPQMNDCRKLHEIVNHYPIEVQRSAARLQDARPQQREVEAIFRSLSRRPSFLVRGSRLRWRRGTVPRRQAWAKLGLELLQRAARCQSWINPEDQHQGSAINVAFCRINHQYSPSILRQPHPGIVEWKHSRLERADEALPQETPSCLMINYAYHDSSSGSHARRCFRAVS